MADYRLQTTSLGEIWIVESMEVLDEVPALLASMLPIFLSDEMPILASLTPEGRASLFKGRLAALASERELRLQDKARTVHGPGVEIL